MLELKHIRKSFDGVTILEDINLTIGDGEIVSILGPSGCGKTTLLNLILGITDADSGQMLFQGQDITRVPMEERGFNIVFQYYALFPNLNVYKNITYGLKNRPGISTNQEVEEFIDLLGLREHLCKRIDQLSGGQKQRVALARTMVMKPRILLLDEPAAGVDFQGERLFWEVLDNARQQQGFTQLMVTHNLPLAAHYADHVIELNKKVIAQGPPQQTLLAPTLMKLFGVPIHLYPNQCEHPEAACNKCGALCHALRMAPAGREDKGQRHA